jgi:ATP-dependent DNA ligase
MGEDHPARAARGSQAPAGRAATAPTGASAINEHFSGDGAVIYKHACGLGCEGIVSKRLGSPYRAGRSAHWLKIKNPAAPAVKREAEEEWR